MLKKLKSSLKAFVQNSRVVYSLYKKIAFLFANLNYGIISKTVKTDAKTILFESFQGRSVTCSPKAIYLAALDDQSYGDYSFVWAVRDLNSYKELEQNRNTGLVKYGSREYLKACAKAKFWVTNSTMPSFVTPKNEQVFIQTWHGTPLKRLGCDIKSEQGKAQKLSSINKQYISQGKKITYFVSPSEFYTDNISSAFNQSKSKFIECGYPRNDFLFCFSDEDVKRVKQSLNIPEYKKVLLYAPTFRDDNFERGKGFHYNIGIDFDLLKKELSKDYVILFRAHYFVVDNFDLSRYKGFVYDVSRYNDVNELYIISDMLLTDYSSVFFDYANLRRPIMFFMYDYELYKNKMRDFYLDITELPGKIAFKNDELVSLVRNAEQRFVYDDKYKQFNEKFNGYNDANSSKRALKKCIK